MTHKHRKLIASFLDIDEEKLSETMRKQWDERHGKSSGRFKSDELKLFLVSDSKLSKFI